MMEGNSLSYTSNNNGHHHGKGDIVVAYSTGGLEVEGDLLFDVARARIKNLKLKTQVVETEETIVEVHADHLAEAHKQHEELQILHQRANDFMDQFDLENNKTVVDTTYANTDMYRNCMLSIPLPEVLELMEHLAPDVEAVRQILTELLTQQVGRRRREFLEEELRNIASLQRNTQVCDIILPLHDLDWSDLLQNSTVWERLHNSDAQVKHLQLRIEETDADRQDALNADDMLLSEQLHDHVIALLEEFIEIVKDRIKICKSRGQRPDLLNKLERFKQDSYDTLDNLKNMQKHLQERISDDMGKMEDYDTRAKQKNNECVAVFEQFKQRNGDELDVNEKKQNDLWAQILDLYEQLKSLGDERWRLATHRIEETEREDNRKAEYNRMRQIHGDHYDALAALKAKTEDCLDMIKSVEDYLNKAADDIYNKSEQIEHELNRLLLDEQKNYLSVYRRYFLTCGELKYKKDKRLVALQKTIRKQDELIETAKETLDPNSKRYKQQQQEFVLLSEEIQKKMNVISNKMDKATDDFGDTEGALNAAGISFLHPGIELQEINVDRRSNLNQVARRYVQADNTDVLSEEDHIRRAAETTEAAKRMGGLSTHLPPQSPTHKRGSRRTGSDVRQHLLNRRTRDEQTLGQDVRPI